MIFSLICQVFIHILFVLHACLHVDGGYTLSYFLLTNDWPLLFLAKIWLMEHTNFIHQKY